MPQKLRFAKAGALAISVVILGVVSVSSAALASDNSMVSISAPATAVDPGTQFTVSIDVTPNNPIAGVQFNLSFDPTIVTVDAVAEGNLLSQSGASTYFDSGDVNATAGIVTGVFGTIISPGQTVSSPGTLAVITMTARNGDGTVLTLSNVVVGDAFGQSMGVGINNSTVSINLPPTLNIIGNKTVSEGETLRFTVSANDPQGGTLVYSASNLPAGASFDAVTRTFTWTPAYGQSGRYSNVLFAVSDGTLLDNETITITVKKSRGQGNSRNQHP